MNRIRAPRFAAITVAVTALAVLAFSSAAPIRAADEVSQTRALSSFERIRLSGAFSTDIAAGSGRSQIVIRGDRDAVDRVTTAVRNGTLEVGMRDGGTLHRPLKLLITLAALREFTSEGAGTAKIAGLTGGDVKITNAGAASVSAAGRASALKIELNGAGKIDTTQLSARDVTVDNNGVGAIYVRASGSLTMNVNGVGEIRYAGDPSHVESHVNGIGRTGRI